LYSTTYSYKISNHDEQLAVQGEALMNAKIVAPRVGISACLLGHPVRFNGGHKKSSLCSDTLASHVEFVPVCPEVAIGLGTLQPERDVTAALAAYGRQVAGQLHDISGFILMQKSPSCGMERVKVYRSDGHTLPDGGSGVFARALIEARPELPVEEDGRLNDAVLRENFLTRVYAYAEWQRLRHDGLSRKAIVDFHSRYKYQLMANHPLQYQVLGRLVARLAEHSLESFAPQYFGQLMQALKQPATRGTHCNVLLHLSGYLKHALGPEDRREMRRLIDQYRAGIVPLVVPLTLLRHHLRHHPDRYLARQAYLQPHPETLSLRNGI